MNLPLTLNTVPISVLIYKLYYLSNVYGKINSDLPASKTFFVYSNE